MRLRDLALLGALIASTTIARSALGADDRARPHATSEAHCALTLDGEGSLSASIVDTPLDEILDLLSRRTGATIAWIAPRSASRATLSFRGLPLTEAIARLLARHNYTLLFTHDGTGRPRLEVRIGSPIEDAPNAMVGILPSAPAVVNPNPGSDRRGHQVALSASGDGGDRVRLETIRGLVEREGSPGQLARLQETLARVVAGGDEEDVERASMIGLAALPEISLESVARTDDSVGRLAMDILERRAEREPLALAVLDRLASDPDSPALEELATQPVADLETADP